MEIREQFFVFGSLFDYCAAMCEDLEELDNCEFINEKIRIKNKLLYFLYKLHNSGIANKIVKLPLKSIWYRFMFDKSKIIGGGGTITFCFLIQILMYIILNF